MIEVVIDTNVLLVAEDRHADVSEECILACVERLQTIMGPRGSRGVVDDAYRILGEYQNKIDLNRDRGAGAVFLKWLINHWANLAQATLHEHAKDHFEEFPVPELEEEFDRADRKFPATSNAHPDKPPILQAVDCKWLKWWPDLAAAGVNVEFLCPDDVCRFYAQKFPGEPAPELP